MKAFPLQGMADRNGQKIEAVYETGMDLRDYFAAKAMQALINEIGFKSDWEQTISAYAYKQANAMMKAREQ